MDAKLLADVNDILAQAGKPVLYRDLVGALRHSHRGGAPTARSNLRWSIRERGWDSFDGELDRAGFHMRFRSYASGLAIYVFNQPFTSVVDCDGKVRPVDIWRTW